jgi:uncharacterized membrane protein
MQILRMLLGWLMGLLYIVAGINHFWHPSFYLNIMPPYLPWHEALMYLSGVIEIFLGLLIFIPRYRTLAAWAIIAMLIAFMPVHIHMLMNPQLYPDIPEYVLWLRLPLQGVLIAWAYWYTRPSPSLQTKHTETALPLT